MAKIVTLDANKLAKNVKINILITGYKKFRLRLLVGSFLIRVGVRVIGADGTIEFDE